MFDTPILFLIFNRPDTTKLVFEAIRNIKPKQLFIAADGPRLDRPGEKEKCRETRSIITKIDWACEVKTLLQPINLGCKVGVSSAINWFFSEVEKGIILEDDCLPDLSFFPFCAELLEKYRDDSRIMMISGDNFLLSKEKVKYSYYFSKYHFIWGWATWRRSWKLYDVNMTNWPLLLDDCNFLALFPGKQERRYWKNILNKTFQGKIDTWDYQWALTKWIHNGLTICPKVNLIKNIGFSREATHTKREVLVANLESHAIPFPIKHPPFCYQDQFLDFIAFQYFFMNGTRIFRAKSKIKRIFQTRWSYEN
jgi:hypothetical protein